MWKPFQVIRNNWKKSIFFTSLAAYGVHLVDQKHRVDQLMRAYCLESAQYGDQSWNPKRPLRHLTIILNPVSGGRKGKKAFSKYIQPILNCAGIKISVIETEHEGQARDYMEVMGNTDGVIIVGGDGTIHEAITGHLRKHGDDKSQKPLPLGFMPVGKHNTGMLKLFQVDVDSNGRFKNKVDHIALLGRLSMSIVKEILKPVDVIKIEGKERGKPVYAFNSFDFGLFHEICEKAENYWILMQTFKPYYPLYKKILFKDISSLKLPVNADIYYTKPCPGCSTCYESLKEPVEKEQPIRWWQRLIPRPNQRKLKVADKYETLKNVTNEECGTWYKVEGDNLINLSLRNSFDKKVEIYLHRTENADKTSLINDGVNFFRSQPPSSQMVERLEARDVSLSLSLAEKEYETNDGEERNNVLSDLWFNIDREKYESQNVLMTLLPNRIMVYS